jgi:hypothetical protein
MATDLRSTLQALRVVTNVARAATLVVPFQAGATFEAVAAQAALFAFRRAIDRIDASGRKENAALRIRVETLVNGRTDA